jgi:hypothetical protein
MAPDACIDGVYTCIYRMVCIRVYSAPHASYRYTHIMRHVYTRVHCMRRRVYTYTHIYTYTRIHVYTYTHIYTYTRIHVYTHTYIHVYTHTYTHVYTRIHIAPHTGSRPTRMRHARSLICDRRHMIANHQRMVTDMRSLGEEETARWDIQRSVARLMICNNDNNNNNNNNDNDNDKL